MVDIIAKLAIFMKELGPVKRQGSLFNHWRGEIHYRIRKRCMLAKSMSIYKVALASKVND